METDMSWAEERNELRKLWPNYTPRQLAEVSLDLAFMIDYRSRQIAKLSDGIEFTNIMQINFEHNEKLKRDGGES